MEIKIKLKPIKLFKKAAPNHILEPSKDEYVETIKKAMEFNLHQVTIYTNNKYFLETI